MVKGSRIGVVVVAFRSATTIERCLEGCTRGEEVTKVVVVDNSSDWLSAELVANFAERATCEVTYMPADCNQGFAAGCMAGVRLLRDVDIVFFVNPDAFLRRTLGELVACSDPNASVVSARLASPDNPRALNARKTVTPSRELAKVVLGSTVYSRGYLRRILRSDVKELVVDQVDGALMGINFDDFHRLGGFDRQFELYYEDVDICRRASALGGVTFVTEVWGEHLGGTSSRQLTRVPYLAARISRVRYLVKYRRRLSPWPTIVGIALIEFITRSLSFQAEGTMVRWEGVRLAWRELRCPGFAQVLQQGEGP